MLRQKNFILKAIAGLMLLLIAMPVFAVSGSLTDQIVHGGASQVIVWGAKNEPNSMDVNISSITWNGQSDFKFRGYAYSNGSATTACTYAKSITGTGYRAATYTSHPAEACMKMSIASTNCCDFLKFSGTYAI